MLRSMIEKISRRLLGSVGRAANRTADAEARLALPPSCHPTDRRRWSAQMLSFPKAASANLASGAQSRVEEGLPRTGSHSAKN